jgi:hypothetical protein
MASMDGDGSLNARTTIEIEIPEFVRRALEFRVAEANAGSPPEEHADLNDIIEWYLVAPISVRDVPALEAAIPGFADALSAWLATGSVEFPAIGL